MSFTHLPQAVCSFCLHCASLPTDDTGLQWFAFFLAMLCFAFGIADFILYICVDDVFVRENKKLVTFHYLVEILFRFPPMVFFFLVWGFWPMLLLFVGDVLLTALLLLFPRFSLTSCGCFGVNRHNTTQLLWSLIISIPLFLVNIVFFDPGMIFFYLNKVFYIVKYVELAGMLYLLDSKGHILTTDHFHMFVSVSVVLVGLNAVNVWFYVPRRRQIKDDRLVDLVDGTDTRVQTIEYSPVDRGRSRTLERLEEIFEMLWLLSQARCRHNQSQILDVIVNKLWLQALLWDGEYDTSTGTVTVEVTTNRGVRFAPSHAAPYDGHLEGTRVHAPHGSGRFEGRSLVWDDGSVWRRQDESDPAAAIMTLILPQLSLALKWDCVEADESDPQARPILSFLMQYALTMRRADFVSELYWALVCLSDGEEPEDELGGHGYQGARLALLRSLSTSDTRRCGEDVGCFLQETRRLLQGHREVWKQVLELMEHTGRSSGGGSWGLRTQVLRNALRRWSELRNTAGKNDIDDMLLGSPRCDAHDVRSPTEGVDLVAPVPKEGLFISHPVDPTNEFRGVVIEESEVIASKHAPMLLFCKTRATSFSRPRAMSSSSADSDDISYEKYLLKVGDDLRQDQLMLQMMALMRCVWEEQLCESDVKMLQLANFRVLAITPRAGYVKFVPDAVDLSQALHQSQGDLVSWLARNHADGVTVDEVMDNFCGSVAASTVVTYVLGIGDRHLENIMLTRRGQLFHVDFSFVLGDDPKPMAPQCRFPQQVAQALLRTNRLSKCFALAGRAYLALRPFAGLWGSLLQFTAAAGGAGCSKLALEPRAVMAGVHERLRIDQMDEERAQSEFLSIMRESSEGLASIFIDKVHACGLFLR